MRRSLDLKSTLEHPCGFNVEAEENIEPAELKALFNVIYTQTEIARDQAGADIKNYVCIQRAVLPKWIHKSCR